MRNICFKSTGKHLCWARPVFSITLVVGGKCLCIFAILRLRYTFFGAAFAQLAKLFLHICQLFNRLAAGALVLLCLQPCDIALDLHNLGRYFSVFHEHNVHKIAHCLNNILRRVVSVNHLTLCKVGADTPSDTPAPVVPNTI